MPDSGSSMGGGQGVATAAAGRHADGDRAGRCGSRNSGIIRNVAQPRWKHLALEYEEATLVAIDHGDNNSQILACLRWSEGNDA
jgi:hypothetical protein